MPGWSETDLEALLNDAFANDGPLVFGGSSSGCVIKSSDQDIGGLGQRRLADRITECYYAQAAFNPDPTIGDTVTVAGTTYIVKYKADKSAGLSCLSLVPSP